MFPLIKGLDAKEYEILCGVWDCRPNVPKWRSNQRETQSGSEAIPVGVDRMTRLMSKAACIPRYPTPRHAPECKNRPRRLPEAEYAHAKRAPQTGTRTALPHSVQHKQRPHRAPALFAGPVCTKTRNHLRMVISSPRLSIWGHDSTSLQSCQAYCDLLCEDCGHFWSVCA